MPNGWNVLVTARAFHDSGIDAWNSLEAARCQLRCSANWGPLSETQMIEELRGIDAVVAATDQYTASIFEASPQLKLVARCGVGIDSVSLDAATEAGVIITNVPDAMTDAVADFCFGLILASVRQICDGAKCMREGGWTDFRGFELAGKVLGLVGFGKIGQSVMRRAIGFGLSIIAHDPGYADPKRREWFPNVEFVSLDELFQRSNIVSLHAPNQPDTFHLVNATRLAMMRRDAVLVNTSRGNLIDEAALIDALQRGSIGGAAIDVYQKEPLPADDPLRNTPRLLLTPHNAFNSIEAAVRMSDGCSQPILEICNGRTPQNVCNPQVLHHPKLRVKAQR